MESRLTDLEIRYAHQEATLESLSESVLQQQRLIETLRDELQRLQQQLRSLAPGDVADPADETPPPHY